MVTDWYPKQEGVIVYGLSVSNAYADGAIAAGSFVTFGTSRANQIAVTASAAVGDAFGVAIKAAAAAGDEVPVLISGVVKVTTNETLSIGELVINESTTEIVGIGASTTVMINSATQRILGIIGQAATDDGDEVLLILGHY